ncbi:hypothetical protein CHEID_08940 [Corynebacterium heidelbergense]|uniref:Amino acid transporter n=2 Tax=Corynebacterium heidelbergense TaxID=2055947 RepID=A0A364VCN2_9CORY|nr:amino acid transporter [Corynebacterium heidelbergense]WCZ37318.1 hypothetical protein CHEID_08940 [Corynebacterium heidelbergense]
MGAEPTSADQESPGAALAQVDPPQEPSGFKRWLLKPNEDEGEPAHTLPGPHGTPPNKEHRRPWWQVMCLTGVDYFSSLGYQPGIAMLAAGLLAPLATIVLVLLTVLGALPVYRRVAQESPTGEGSIRMLERLMPRWWGKLFVLVLLGFAATDFLITMTLSAADAAEHLVSNPLAPHWLHGATLWVTLTMLALLAAVFLKGFTEVIGVSVILVFVYLTLNVIVLVTGVVGIFSEPHVVLEWRNLAESQHGGNWAAMIGISLIVFPKLALGMSGFETGVAVMPQIRARNLEERIRGARKLLATSATIMSIALLLSSAVCTLLIPQEEFQPGGSANGRALAYLAHERLGNGFGTVYDISTILILWFAGASAMAGLLNLVPRYLPRYGMAPEWARLTRPLVLVFGLIAVAVTVYFKADVDAQGGAYATGVLVLMTSAAVAVALSARKKAQKKQFIGFTAVAVVFLYTTITNIIERPEGVQVASLFILAIIAVSIISRVQRAFELRTSSVAFDEKAVELVQHVVRSGGGERIVLIAHDPHRHSFADYVEKESVQRRINRLPGDLIPLFVEIQLRDASEFSTDLLVKGMERYGHHVLQVEAPSIGNSMAAVLLHLRDMTGIVPDAYFEWFEGNPFASFIRFLFLGEGENAAVAHEVLRRAESNPSERPRVHVG